MNYKLMSEYYWAYVDYGWKRHLFFGIPDLPTDSQDDRMAARALVVLLGRLKVF